MNLNLIGEYRKSYLTNRQKNVASDESHAIALNTVYVKMLKESAATKMPISEYDMELIHDLNTNKHYVKLLEEILHMPMNEQKEYLRQVAKIPDLKLVK
jgi:hypothetical protein